MAGTIAIMLVRSRHGEHIVELNKRCAETELPLKQLYHAIEVGVTDLDDPKDRIEGLRALRDQAKAISEYAQAMLESSSQQAIMPQMVQQFAANECKRIRIKSGGYYRDHLRAFAQRVKVVEREVFIKGS